MLETLQWSREAGLTRMQDRGQLPVAPDVFGVRIVMVNVYFIDRPHGEGWVLIDAGLPGSAKAIRDAADKRYGPGARPEAIILTHAHFDHVGAIKTLAEAWDVPVYVHPLELPYVTGQASYAPPDPWVGGAMSLTSPLYPRGPIDLGNRVHPLPTDHRVPHLPDWRWVPTPGHSPGHVSIFRATDRVLIAGDAIVTTKQESAIAVLTQAEHVCGPPPYFTHDWQAAEESVRRLAELNPSILATGHGSPMFGPKLEQQLTDLANNFRQRAVPKHGRYASRPVVYDQTGPQQIPPPRVAPLALVLGGILLAGAAISMMGRDRREE